MRLAKFDDAGFGPEAFIAGRVGDEAAVATVLGGNELNIAIAADAWIAKSVERHEGIVLGSDEECGDADGGYDAGGGSAVVVVVGVAKATIRRGNFVVEFADAANFVEAIDGVFVRVEFDFGAHAFFEAADKVSLVDQVLALRERVSAGVEDEGRADGDDAAELQRCVVTHFAGHFEDDVAAHGKTGGEDFGKRSGDEEFVDDGFDVAAEAGIVESGSEFFAASAVALIEADGVEAGDVGFFGGAQHIAGLAGTFEAVEQDDGGVILRTRLPVAMGKNTCAGFGFKFAS